MRLLWTTGTFVKREAGGDKEIGSNFVILYLAPPKNLWVLPCGFPGSEIFHDPSLPAAPFSTDEFRGESMECLGGSRFLAGICPELNRRRQEVKKDREGAMLNRLVILSEARRSRRI